MLAAAGFLCSLYLERVHANLYLRPGAGAVCRVGEAFDCQAVAASPWAVIGGVPLPIWGMVGFGALFVAAHQRSLLLLPLAALAAMASLGLLGIELVVIGSVCLFCEVVHLLSWAILVLAYRDWRRGRLERPTRAFAGAVLGAAVLLLGAVAIAMPKYWQGLTWRGELGLPHGQTETQDPWIGATAPVVTIHEYTDYHCPFCALSARRTFRRLALHGRAIRLVRHPHPRMPCHVTNPHACRTVRLAYCAGEQGKFWQADQWLFAHAVGVAEADAAQAADDLDLDGAALVACMGRSEIQERAHRVYQEALRRGIQETPTFVVDGQVLTEGELFELLRAKGL